MLYLNLVLKERSDWNGRGGSNRGRHYPVILKKEFQLISINIVNIPCKIRDSLDFIVIDC